MWVPSDEGEILDDDSFGIARCANGRLLARCAKGRLLGLSLGDLSIV